MADWNALAENLDFDLWANRKWLECLDRKGTGDPDRAVLSHILSANLVWVTRCHGESLTAMPKVVPTEAAMAELNAQWRLAIAKLQDDPVIHYRRTTGEENSLLFSSIIRHVTNHGTYHRGELRGLCLARGDEDFPETDFMLYLFEINQTN